MFGSCKAIVLRQATKTANLRPNFQKTKIRSFLYAKIVPKTKGGKEHGNFQSKENKRFHNYVQS
ncbi:MAG: hypothetical protein ACI4DP_01835, partial [Candidatus Ornithomonoglobus sp.]